MSSTFVGQYELYKRLYKTNTYSIYRARHVELDREAMLKVIPFSRHDNESDWEEVCTRFLQEAKAMGRLAHRNIVPVTDAGKDEKCLYIVMAYVAGDRLDSYADPDYLLPAATVCRIVEQVALALDHAHEQSIVHRDVKPENIIFNKDSETAFLTDFSIARILDNSHTRTGTVLGSPSYMSPEQVQGKKLDHRTDLYSLGVSMFQLLTGWLPFSNSPLPKLMMEIVAQEPKNISELRPDLPGYVCDVIRFSMKKDPASRYEDAKAMARAARSCTDRLGQEMSPQRPSTTEV